MAGKIQQGSAWWVQRPQDWNDQTDDISGKPGTSWKFPWNADRFQKLFCLIQDMSISDGILCNLIGGWVENGEYPADEEILGRIVQDISYNNAVRYFGFEV